jgi:hypothetical protein
MSSETLDVPKRRCKFLLQVIRDDKILFAHQINFGFCHIRTPILNDCGNCQVITNLNEVSKTELQLTLDNTKLIDLRAIGEEWFGVNDRAKFILAQQSAT